MKRVGFYGHSNCAYRSPDSFIDILSNQFNAEIVNIGTRQGSEERVLFELKKTKNLDLAVIFHCPHNLLFIPGSDRDFALGKQITKKAEYMWRKQQSESLNASWNFHKEHHTKFIEKFETPDKFIQVMSDYRIYLEHPDLVMNRFYGALIQIDQYLSSKNINAIHIVIPEVAMPTWFKFQSGVVENTVADLLEEHASSDQWFVNCITQQGNILVAERLKEVITTNNFLELRALEE